MSTNRNTERRSGNTYNPDWKPQPLAQAMLEAGFSREHVRACGFGIATVDDGRAFIWLIGKEKFLKWVKEFDV